MIRVIIFKSFCLWLKVSLGTLFIQIANMKDHKGDAEEYFLEMMVWGEVSVAGDRCLPNSSYLWKCQGKCHPD